MAFNGNYEDYENMDVVHDSCEESPDDFGYFMTLPHCESTTDDDSDPNESDPVHNEIDNLIMNMSEEEEQAENGQCPSDQHIDDLDVSQEQSFTSLQLSSTVADDISDLSSIFNPKSPTSNHPTNRNNESDAEDQGTSLSLQDDTDNDQEQNSPSENPFQDSDGESETVDLDLCTDIENLYGHPGEALDPDLNSLLKKEPNWIQEDFKPVHVRAFTGSGQVNIPQTFDKCGAHAIDYWNMFVSDDMICKICENTNKYHQFKVNLKRQVRPNYVDKEWYDLTEPECKAWLGMSIIMGISSPRRYKYIWSSNKYL